MKTIYQPSEDSYLLQKTLTNYLTNKPKNIKILDMGSGSGIQAQTCKDLGFKNITTADINPEVINHLKKQKLNPIQSNLFSKIPKKEKFNLIIFNPPYLPEDKREPKDSQLQTTGGKKGYEIIIRFLKQAKSHLEPKAEILLLFSSLSKPSVILKTARQLNYKTKQLDKKKLFFEELSVYKFNNNNKK